MKVTTFFRVLLLWVFFPNYVYADKPCVESEGVDDYADLVSISYYKNNDDYEILVQAPTNIKNLKFVSMNILNGEDGSVFLIPLYSVKENNKQIAQFFLNKYTINNTSINVYYAESKIYCGFTINIRLDPKTK